jgi:tripartite-type tricarboxylate transporter receptor subunit TctC
MKSEMRRLAARAGLAPFAPSKIWFTSALLLALAASAGGTSAASYPTQPVKIIIQAPAGNGPDVLARIIAERLGQLWGQQVLILNRPGAGGLIAAQAAAGAQPDGYTLYMPSSSTFLVLPARHAKLPFDLDRDFVRIGLVAQAPLVIAAAPSLGINSVPDLIARAKERPGDIMYAALGRGTLPHATSELFQRRAGIELRYISYGATHQALQDVMGGRLGLVFDGLGALAGALETGSVKALATTAPERLPHFPHLPTVAETLPDFVALSWSPMLAPAGTPAHIVEKVSADLRAVLAQPGLQERLRHIGHTVRPMSPAEVTTFIDSERRRWRSILNGTAPETR